MYWRGFLLDLQCHHVNQKVQKWLFLLRILKKNNLQGGYRWPYPTALWRVYWHTALLFGILAAHQQVGEPFTLKSIKSEDISCGLIWRKIGSSRCTSPKTCYEWIWVTWGGASQMHNFAVTLWLHLGMGVMMIPL